ncbi:hypothetical protein AgCh_020066 [Apium graveolens]
MLTRAKVQGAFSTYRMLYLIEEIITKSNLVSDNVNDLRLDMATLHHMMNNMEMMLEDMQLELQRSFRHEVFAALHLQSGSTGIS